MIANECVDYEVMILFPNVHSFCVQSNHPVHVGCSWSCEQYRGQAVSAVRTARAEQHPDYATMRSLLDDQIDWSSSWWEAMQ